MQYDKETFLAARENLKKKLSQASKYMGEQGQFWKNESQQFWRDELLPHLESHKKDLGSFLAVTYEKYVVRGEYTRRHIAILFGVAVVIGAIFKFVASENFTVGFDDYTLAKKETLYDMNRLKRDAFTAVTAADDERAGKTCSEFDN